MKQYVRFHIGRAGRAGQLSFVNEDNFQELLRQCELYAQTEEYDPETDEYTPLPEEQWRYEDANGNILVEGRDAMEADTGRLVWDGEYDTDYVTTTDDLSAKELECLLAAYHNYAYMSDDLKDTICTLKGKK